MSKLSCVLAWTTLILLVLMLSGLGSEVAFAADRKTKAGSGGIELAPVGTRFTLNGYRANGTGSPDVRWVTGNLGNTWGEGEWVPYMLKMTGVPSGLVGLDSIGVSYDFMYPHGGDMYRFVDLVRGIQVGTTVLTENQGWPAADGSAMPTTTDTELETAQNTPNEYFWTGFTPLNLPDEQINRTVGGGLDVPPGADRHILRINKSDLIAAGVPTNASTIVIYFQLHLARTVIWNNQLQSGYDVAPADSWGGYLYGTDGWPTAPPMVGSGYVPGSSGHVGMEYPVTGRTVGLPIPEPSAGETSGLKWQDLNGDGVMDGGEPPIPGWEIHVFGRVDGVDFATSVLTDAGGTYVFDHLTPGTVWTIKEDAQRDVPAEVGYYQTYPSVGTTVGVGTGVAVGPPPTDVAGVGWSVALTSNDEVQPNMNFGNGRYEIGIICPDDIFISCDESIDPSNTGEPTVEGQCPCAPGAVCDPVLTYDDVIIPGACPQEYTIERTWTAECVGEGIIVTCLQTITVEDNTPPYWITTCPADIAVECDAVPEPDVMEAVDACDEDVSVSFDEQRTDGSCPDAYTLTRTWTATDDCGNDTECVQVLTVLDRTDPVIACPPDDTFECDETVVFGTATATDNCDPDPEITYDDETIPGSCPDSYTIERTWTATDRCGNTDECVQVVTVLDRTDPYWTSTCPADDTVECDDIPTAPTMTAEDNCDDDVFVDYDEQRTDGVCPDSYTLTRTWTATDDCGNDTECVQVLTVLDRTDPVVTCPPDDTFECDETVVFGTATATDNCDPDPEITYDDETIPGSCPDSYTIERTWTATDRCGNTDECVQVVTVLDRTDPVITCPPDDTFECDETVVFGTATATDNCDPDPEITYDDETIPGSCPDSYTIERTWTATDRCGNTDECVQVVTVLDRTDPYWTSTCPADDTVECDDIPTAPTMTAEDNCDDDVFVDYDEQRTDGVCPDSYTLTRTWTATDDCGNDTECVQVLTVVDRTDPYWVTTCPVDDTVECDDIPTAPTMTAEDNCDDDVFVDYDEQRTDGVCPDSYTLTRTWTATDDCGNDIECVQVLTVVDRTDPYWVTTCPVDDTVECDDIPTAPTMTAEDNCDDDVFVDYDEQRTDGVCPDSYTLTRTWTATDDCGNDIECVQVLTVLDRTDPYWVTTCPVDDTVECDDIPTAPTMTAEDNCDDDVFVDYDEQRTDGVCPDSYTLTRTWTATDDCGNDIECVQVLTVLDRTDPYWVTTCPVDDTVECDDIPTAPTMTAEDNCDDDVFVDYDEQRTDGVCPDSYTLTRTWTATDDCGNDTECVQVLTVVDRTDPYWVTTCPADDTVECDNVPTAPTMSAEDNCDDDVDVQYDQRRVDGSCPDGYTLVRTWTATDDCGNDTECVQNLTVRDTTDPEITCPSDRRFDCDETVDFGLATATDNCDPDPQITYDDNVIPGGNPHERVVERTWTATDACGNTDQCVQTVTIVDDTDPVITCPADDTFECDETIVFGTATATDNCDPDPEITFDDETIPGSCPGNYTIERTWTATDAAGNTDECVQTITVEDTTDPVITCPPDDTFECDESVVFGLATATDNCDPDPEITFDDETIPGSCSDNYTIERTWTATDYCGNTDQCVQTITVEDTTDPVITCPPDDTFECDESVVFGLATATDNCDPDPEITFDDETIPGSCSDNYTIERTWTATDYCGNTDQCVQTITVEDTTDPVITCPPDDTFECDETIVFGLATATDNCDPDPEITYDDNTVPGSNPNEYVIERTWTATDVCGNTGQCVQRITIVDGTPPQITCPPDDTFECDETIVFGLATATDNCDPDPDITFDDIEIQGDCPNEYMIERTWTAMDAAGNSASCLQLINVVDTTPPVITCAPDKVAGCLDDVVFDTPTASDNCGEVPPTIDIVSTITEPGPGLCQETHTRTWEAVDVCGNASRCSQAIVQVFDETPPTLTCVDDKRIACNADVVFDAPAVFDACDPSPVVTIVSTVMEPGPGLCEETHIRTWEAEDACANVSAQCSQVITRVVDNEPPVLTAADDKILPCNGTVVFDPPEIIDNCDPDPALEVVSTVITDGSELCVEIHTRCWIGIDACGNESAEVCQNVTVKVDTEAPVLTCAPDKTIPHGEEPIFDEPTVTDNCLVSGSIVETSNTQTSDPETQQEVYEQCWIVSDDCGNLSNECCQTITVEGPPEPYCTFRCWDWGADCLEDPNTPVSTTPACIRDMYFDDLYPDGVMVGKEGARTAVWTSPLAIENFLCSYGIPKVLRRDYVNPQRYELLGVLVGEVLCLRLNRDFSCAGYLSGLGYPAPGACYGDYVLPEEMPRFAGLTVDEFLEVCDQTVSGNTAVLRDYGANIDHLYSAAVYVNWLFSGCNGAPTEPPLLVSGHDEDEITEPAGEPLPVKLSLSVQPNPLYGSTTMRLALPADAEVSIAIYDIQGRQVAGLVSEFKTAGIHDVAWNGTDDRGSALASGVYFCRVQINQRVALMEKLVKL